MKKKKSIDKIPTEKVRPINGPSFGKKRNSVEMINVDNRKTITVTTS